MEFLRGFRPGDFSVDFFYSFSGNSSRFAPGISPRTFFQSSSSNSTGIPPVIPPDVLREFLQSSYGNSFRTTPGILTKISSEFLQLLWSFYRNYFGVCLENLSWFLQDFIWIFAGCSVGGPPRISSDFLHGFFRNSFGVPAKNPSSSFRNSFENPLKFLQSSFGISSKVSSGISPENIKKKKRFRSKRSGKCSGVPPGIPLQILHEFLEFLMEFIRSSSESFFRFQIWSSTGNSFGLPPKFRQEFDGRFSRNSSELLHQFHGNPLEFLSEFFWSSSNKSSEIPPEFHQEWLWGYSNFFPEFLQQFQFFRKSLRSSTENIFVALPEILSKLCCEFYRDSSGNSGWGSLCYENHR